MKTYRKFWRSRQETFLTLYPSLRCIPHSSRLLKKFNQCWRQCWAGPWDRAKQVRPRGAGGCPRAQQKQGGILPSSRSWRHPAGCLAWAPRHTRSMERLPMNHTLASRLHWLSEGPPAGLPGETSPGNCMWAHIWLQEECQGKPLRDCLNPRNSKSLVSGGINHPLDTGQPSAEINLLPDRGRRETFAVSWAGWGLTAHLYLSRFP